MASQDSRFDGSHSDVEQSTSPLSYEYWYGEGDLSQRDIDEINSAAFATAADADDNNEQICDRDCMSNESSGSAVPTVSRRRKKPKGFPKRPLSGYNLFFKEERVKVLQESIVEHSTDEGNAFGADSYRSKVSFQDLGKIIGKRWKSLNEESKRKYDGLAEHDSGRYRNEMDMYNEAKRRRNEEKNQKAFTGDVDDFKATPSTGWSTMILSRPPELCSLSQLPVRASLPREKSANPRNLESCQQPQRASASLKSEENNFSFPIPPGTELVLHDHHGLERVYQVQYKFYKMTLKDAEAYMEQLASTPAMAPYGFTDYPPPPPGARYEIVNTIPFSFLPASHSRSFLFV
jgi:HMG (high mobility group) box